MYLAYRYRLLPSKRQHRALEEILESQRQLYNAALEERIDCYRKTGRSRLFLDQSKALTECRDALSDMRALPLKLQRWTLRRVDDAYQSFFSRLKAKKQKTGFPRYRGSSRWRAFGFSEFRGIRLVKKRLRFLGMPGGLKVHFHRSLPKDVTIKGCVFRRDSRGWCVFLTVKVGIPEKKPVATMVGVDIGLKVFAYCSDGVIVPNPRIAMKAERAQRVAQRAFSRCKRDSNRRRKTKERLLRLYKKIGDTRSTWLHQQSAALVNRTDLIAIEDLNVQGLAKGYLAKSVYDASWSTFFEMLRYKAERAGAHLIRVDSKFTTQDCSGCGERVPKPLWQRTHSCPHCGLVMDRDENAALNVLHKAVAGLGTHNVAPWGERAFGNISQADTLPSGSLSSPGRQ